MSSHISNERPEPDRVIADIADYALEYEVKSDWPTRPRATA